MSGHMEQDRPIPPVPERLLQKLEEMFPPISPTLDWTEKRIWYEAGRRAVVELLRREFDSEKQRRS